MIVNTNITAGGTHAAAICYYYQCITFEQHHPKMRAHFMTMEGVYANRLAATIEVHIIIRGRYIYANCYGYILHTCIHTRQ